MTSYTGMFQISAVTTGFGSNGTDYKLSGGQSEPTKSAIVGMLAAACGRRRGDSIADLNALQIGAVTVNPGVIHTRYSVVTDARTHEGKLQRDPIERRRSYFQAANQSDSGDWLVRHIVAFQSDDEQFVRHLLKKLTVPTFPIFIGRRNCTPAEPLPLGYLEGTLFDAFKLVKVPGTATIEVTPGATFVHKRRVLDQLSDFKTRQVTSRMVIRHRL